MNSRYEKMFNNMSFQPQLASFFQNGQGYILHFSAPGCTSLQEMLCKNYKKIEQSILEFFSNIGKIPFWILAIFITLYLGNGKSYKKSIDTILKPHFIWNSKKKLHQNLMRDERLRWKNSTKYRFGPLWASFFETVYATSFIFINCLMLIG